ncbi:hypothetical protein K402DRAFT_453210 [Aulographum hederae CBS 113979]|uniref:Mid2 domain-containing protein n=1 Tax=Aulographum hederae CBS 113979 TaxID=1176131 RepID=A0A6G1H4T2_9PEZI|nr:hypothetical protein K402DRAFT_453210 [Aulographum hederae CBS 113979]
MSNSNQGRDNPCYEYQNGSIHNDFPEWHPCGGIPPGNTVVSCCKGTDQCVTNGLCHYTHDLVGGSGYYAGACTDPTYRDSSCPLLCNDRVLPDVKYNTSQSAWQCCGMNPSTNRPSCPRPIGDQFFDAPPPSALSTYAVAATTSATGTIATTSHSTRTRLPSSRTGSATASPTSGADTSSELSTGAKAGIGVGVALGALILVAIACFFIHRQRRKKAYAAVELDSNNSRAGGKSSPFPDHGGRGDNVAMKMAPMGGASEMDSSAVHEMPTTANESVAVNPGRPQEVEGSSVDPVLGGKRVLAVNPDRPQELGTGQ